MSAGCKKGAQSDPEGGQKGDEKLFGLTGTLNKQNALSTSILKTQTVYLYVYTRRRLRSDRIQKTTI
jgi:hypothetical protein